MLIAAAEQQRMQQNMGVAMSSSKALRLATVAIFAALSAPLAAVAQDRNISFVACPILQDTNSVPCWMAEYEGELYFLGMQTDTAGWTPPQLSHKLLVEGTISDNPRVCGGIVLQSSGTIFDRPSAGRAAGVELPNPPVTSVMREVDISCRTILPEQPRFNNLEIRRGPGPSNPRPPSTPEQIAAAAREAAERAEAQRPVAPYQAREYEMYYEFDSELASLTFREIPEALNYARAIGASKISVVGYRSSSLLSNGTYLEEIPVIAERRAKELESSIRMLGLPEGTILDVSWEPAILQGNGRDDWTRRKATVVVTP